MTTIKDIAELAGVSTTTVSYVINKTRYVSDELTIRVIDAMETLDYHPNILARSLRSGSTKTIGLVIPDITNQFFSEISRLIEDKGFEFGYSVILCNTDDDLDKEKHYIDVMINKQIDGVIFISSGNSSEVLAKAEKFNIPIVLADRNIENTSFDLVLTNNFKGGYDATKYLIDLGHQKIACIAGPSLITPSSDRLTGYKQALSDSGIPFDPTLVIHGDFHFESGIIATKSILERSKDTSAVFACNDMMALGAMRTIHNSGLEIPGDISVIGFDNVPLSHTAYPALTTIAQPINQISVLSVEYLLERIRNKSKSNKDYQRTKIPYRKELLDTRLVVRASCGKANHS